MLLQAKKLEEAMDAALIEVEYQISVDSCKDHDVSHILDSCSCRLSFGTVRLCSGSAQEKCCHSKSVLFSS